jgi:UDP-glucose 4-epimerase
VRALVTGGLGFVGSYVVCCLHQKGYEVHVLDNLFVSSLQRTQDLPPGTNVHLDDIRDEGRMTTLIKQIQPDVVVHLAALHYIPYCNANPLECYDVNVRGTIILLETLEKYCDVKRFFLASSAAVYEPSDTPHQEEDPAWPSDVYGFSKRAAEYYCFNWSSRTGTPVVIGRYFNVFGYGETSPHIIPVLVQQVLTNGRQIKVGNTSSRRDYIHATDIAQITCELIALPVDGVLIVNIGTGRSYSVDEIIEFLGDLSHQRLEILQDPERMRKTDRPNLSADLSRLRSLGIASPRITLTEGLGELLTRGIGPYLSLKLGNYLGDKQVLCHKEEI